jgi:hypothetical protein
MRHPSNSVTEVRTQKVSIEIEGAPKGEWKALGGSDQRSDDPTETRWRHSTIYGVADSGHHCGGSLRPGRCNRPAREMGISKVEAFRW